MSELKSTISDAEEMVKFFKFSTAHYIGDVTVMCQREADFQRFDVDLNYYNSTERFLYQKYPLDASA